MRLSGKRLLRETFGSKGDEKTGEWRRLCKEELHGLYSSTNIIRCDQIKKNEMGRACEIVWDIGAMHTGVSRGDLISRLQLEDLGEDRRILGI